MRQLVAILFSDIVGYSRQMNEDEAGALVRLEKHNRVMRESISRHEGTVVKTGGDSFVVTFVSAVTAVECALDAQRSLDLHNSISPDADRIDVRMGIHAGDVVLRDGDLFGEAVNIAARLEPLAPPGGVCVSRAVYDQIRRKVHATSADLGLVSLKNIAEPVELFTLRPGDELVGSGATPRPVARGGRRLFASIAALAVVAATATAIRHFADRFGSPRRGGVLRLASGFDAENFDVYSSEPTRTRMALALVVEPLLRDKDEGDDSVPDVLEKTAVLDSGRTLSLILRHDVYFHDHPCFPGGTGRLAASADLAWSIDRAARLGHLALPIAGAPGTGTGLAEGIHVSGDTVTVSMSEPAPFFARELSHVWLLPHDLEGCEDVSRMRQPVGTGPFRFDRPPANAKISLVRAPRYWRLGSDAKPLPYLDGIEIDEAQEPAAMLTRLQRGELDAYLPKPADWPKLLDLDHERPHLVEGFERLPLDVGAAAPRASLRMNALVVTRRNGPLQDKRIRRAVALALDRRALVDSDPDHTLRASAGRFLEPRFLGYDAALPSFGLDLPAARSLLEQAGHPRGATLPPLEIGVMNEGVAANAPLAGQLNEVGLRLHPVRITDNTITEMLGETSSVDAVMLSMKFDAPEGEVADFVNGFDQKRTPFLQGLSKKVATTADRGERALIYAQIEAALMDELPSIPIAWMKEDRPVMVVIHRRNVRRLSDPATALFEEKSLSEVWLDRPAAAR